MIGLICKKEAGRRHCAEELEHFETGQRVKVLQIGGNVIKNSKQGGVYRV